MTTTVENSTQPSNKYGRIGLWLLQILAAAGFIAAGSAKLASVKQMVDIFQQIGIGQWFRYLTGGVEVIAGVALLIPAVAAFGAVALVATMTGAIVTHVFVIGGSPAPAMVLLAITATIAWFRRGTFVTRR